MRGLDYSDLTGRNLVFWESGCVGEVVVYERWSLRKVVAHGGSTAQ